jgi:hypothetical protein
VSGVYDDYYASTDDYHFLPYNHWRPNYDIWAYDYGSTYHYVTANYRSA